MYTKKKSKLLSLLKWTAPPLAALLLLFYFSLPFIVERMVLPEVAAAFGVEFFTADVRNIDINSIDLADVALGETPGGGQFKLDSVRIDYHIGFTGAEITRLRISGVELDLDINEQGVIKVAGKTTDQWMKSFSGGSNPEQKAAKESQKNDAANESRKADAATGAGSHPLLSSGIDRLELVHSQLHLTGPDFEWTLPVNLEATLPSQVYPRLELDFRIEQARDNIAGNLFFDAEEKRGDFDLSASLSLQRYLQLLPQTKELPVSGGVTMQLSGEFTDHVTSADFSISSRRLKYGAITIAADGHWIYDPENELPWQAGSEFHITAADQTFGAYLTDCAALIDLAAKRVRFASAITAKIPQLPEQRLTGEINFAWSNAVAADGALVLVSAAAPLRLNWDFSADGAPVFNAKVDAMGTDAIAITLPGGINTVISEPRLAFHAKKAAKEWRYTCAASVKNIAADTADWRIEATPSLDWEHGDHPYLRFKSGLSGRWHEIEAAADVALDLKTGATGITGGECSITGLKTSILPTKLVKFNAAFDLTPPRPGSRAVRRAWRADWDCGIHLAGMSAVTDSGWLIDGTVWHGEVKPPNATKFNLDIAGTPNFLVKAAIQMPPTELNTDLIHRLVPKTEGWTFSGRVSASADYRFGFGNNRGEANVKIMDANAENAEAGVKITGLDAEMTLPALPRPATAADQTLAVKSIRATGVELNDLYIDYQASPDGLFVTEAGLEAFGGSVTTYALNLKPGDKQINANLFCDGLKLADFINTFNFARAAGAGRIYGRVPISIGYDGIFVKRGYLYSEPGVKEMFKLTGLNAGVDFENSGAVELDLAQEALRSFTYDWVKIDFSQDGEDLVLAAIFSGKPDGDLPFTFDAERGGFLRVSYPGARFQGIELTLRWKLPLNRLLELNDKYAKLKERLGL
ncbi:MAG: YdbH domain-containing protein [Victivallaceae bacterium]|nr:YdbH domain-containing protein [Victivallaceae bacterium]